MGKALSRQLPELPPGFQLETQSPSIPPLPPGFVLEAATPAPTTTKPFTPVAQTPIPPAGEVPPRKTSAQVLHEHRQAVAPERLPGQPQESLLDPFITLLSPLLKVPLTGIPAQLRHVLDTPEGSALADTARGLATPENVAIGAGIGAANLVPYIGTAVDVGAAGYFGKQMLEAGMQAEADMNAAQTNAVTARQRGDETSAKQFDEKARYARAQKYIASTFAVLLAKGGIKKGAEAATGHITETPQLSPEEIQKRLLTDHPERLTDEQKYRAEVSAAKDELLKERPYPNPDELRETAIRRANNRRAAQEADTETPAAEPTEAAAPLPTEPPAESSPEAPEAPTVTPGAETGGPETITPPIPPGFQLETPTAEAPATYSPEDVSLTPEEPMTSGAGSPPKTETKPESTVASFREDQDALRNHPVRPTDASTREEYANFEKRVRAAGEKAGDASLTDYIRQLGETIQRHAPENEAAGPHLLDAQEASQEGRLGDAAWAAERARGELSQEYQRRVAEESYRRATGEEPPAREKPVAEPAKKPIPPLRGPKVGETEEETPPPKAPNPEGYDELLRHHAETEMVRWADQSDDALSYRQAVRAGHTGSPEDWQALNAEGKLAEEERIAKAKAITTSGTKEATPLEDFKETPRQLLNAIRKGRGKLYDEILAEFIRHHDRIEGDALREYLTNPPEEDLGAVSETHVGADEGDLSFDFGEEAIRQLDEAADRTLAEIKADISSIAKGETLGANLPAAVLGKFVKYGAIKIAKGTVKFAQWSKEMVEELGELVTPHLRTIYDRALLNVQSGKDSGLPQSAIDAILSPHGLAGKYVKNEPIEIRFGKTDKATAKTFREEKVGIENAQISRVNHLADTIRKSVPDKTDRQGLFWYKAANGDLDLVREKLADPRYERYKAGLQKALNLSPEAMKALKEVGTYYAEAGAVSREIGTIRTLRENYQTRIYAPEPPKDFVKTEMGGGLRPATGHAQHRVFNTEFEAVEAGKKFATTDIADALEIHNREMAKVNTSRKLLDAMAENNVGKWVRKGKVPDGWQQVGELEKNVPIRDADGNPVLDAKGNQVISHSVFAAPKGIADGLRAITDRNFLDNISGYKSLAKFQAIVKTVDLSLSFFHDKALTSVALFQGGIKNIGQMITGRMGKIMEGPDWQNLETDFARNLGITSRIQTNVDILRSLVDKNPDTFTEKIRNLPGLKQMADLSDKHTQFLFGQLQRFLKVQDYGRKISNWVAKHPDATDMEVREAKRGFAREVNAAFGGLNWQAMGITKTQLAILRAGLLAPDWSLSNGILVKQAFDKGPAGNAARAHFLRTAVIGLVATEALSKLWTGHTTDQNPSGHKLEIEVSPGVYVSILPGATGDAIKAWSMISQGGLAGVAQFAQGKLAPIPRTAVGYLSGAEYSGRPISPPGRGPIGKTADTLSYIARSAGPVPFGLANTAKYLEDSQRTVSGGVAVATGLGRYAPRSAKQQVSDYLSKPTADLLSKYKIGVGSVVRQDPGESAESLRLRNKIVAQLVNEYMADVKIDSSDTAEDNKSYVKKIEGKARDKAAKVFKQTKPMSNKERVDYLNGWLKDNPQAN